LLKRVEDLVTTVFPTVTPVTEWDPLPNIFSDDPLEFRMFVALNIPQRF